MITIFSPNHTLHAPPHEFFNGTLIPSHESPQRVTIIYEALERAALGPIRPPRSFTIEQIEAVHDRKYLDYLESAYERWVASGGSPLAVIPDTLAVRWMARPSTSPLAMPGYFASDLSAPIVDGTYRAALASANVALTGAALLAEGQHVVYALCRPPGHHAGSDMCGGYCFLNNAAIAAEYLLQAIKNDSLPSTTVSPSSSSHDPLAARVAILDIDYHHGNGTQQIFYARGDVLTVSIHADPARQYPYFAGYADERGQGAGLDYNLNLPLEAEITDERYLDTLEQALAVIADFAPRFLVLSAGFDTFSGDPIGDFALTTAVYRSIGERIAALRFPTLIVQEGGYAMTELGENVVELLRGFTSLDHHE